LQIFQTLAQSGHDTVGFINNLPSNLVESFKSTLEEIRNAHFLVHVVDITSRDIDAAIETVNRELRALDCGEKETLLFFNKADLLRDDPGALETVSNRFPDAVIGSAAAGDGTDILKRRITEIYDSVQSKECQDSDDSGRNGKYECF